VNAEEVVGINRRNNRRVKGSDGDGDKKGRSDGDGEDEHSKRRWGR
jgi:hypothetical protein